MASLSPFLGGITPNPSAAWTIKRNGQYVFTKAMAHSKCSLVLDVEKVRADHLSAYPAHKIPLLILTLLYSFDGHCLLELLCGLF